MKIKDLIRVITSGLKDSYDIYNMPIRTIIFKDVVEDFDTFFKKEEDFFKKIKLNLTKEDLIQLTNDGKELNKLQNKIEEECVNIAKRELETFLNHIPKQKMQEVEFDKSNLEKQKSVINAFCAVFSHSMLFLHPAPKKIINEKYLGCDFFEYDAYAKCILEGSKNIVASQYKMFVLLLKRLEIAFKLRNNGVSEEKLTIIKDINKELNLSCRNLFDEIYSYDKLKDSKEIYFDNTKEDLILLDFINLSDSLDSFIISNIIYSYFYKYQTQSEIISEMDDRGLKDLTPLIELIQRNIKDGADKVKLTRLISDVAEGKRRITYNEITNNIK